jgi:hypothetical protein
MVERFLTQIQKSTQHNCFYHFTDRRNLESIRRAGGILCMRSLRENGITIPAPGGNDWSMDADRICHMDQYVHLCFTRGHPMRHLAEKEGRITDAVWLRINPEVIRLPGVMITDEVANKSGVVPQPVVHALPKIDLEVIYTRMDWRIPAIKQRLDVVDKYEIIVPNIVPLRFIQNAHG